MTFSPFERFSLGRCGISVSKIALGSLVMGPLQANLPVEEGGELISYAYSKGINYVDTAQLYETYSYIKAALPLCPNLIISSKTYAYNRELAHHAVENARFALDRDYIDIFMLHEQESIHTVRGHMEALEYLQDCKAKGIIKAVGISTHFVAGAIAAYESGKFDLLHPLINLRGIGIVDGNSSDMERAVEAAHLQGLGTVGMKAFAGGNLHSTPTEALSYVLNLPFLDTIAIGVQSKTEIDANLHFLEHGFFKEESLATLHGRKKRLLIETWCIGCGACVSICKGGALGIKDGRSEVDPSRCLLCGYCSSACKEMAIKIF